MNAVVDAHQLARRFGRRRAVDHVDLRIDGPGVVGVLGPNGSGKTTLLRMLAAVLEPSAGALRIFGGDPSRPGERTAIRRRLGYLPQLPTLYAGFTAFDVVDYVAVLKELTDRDERHEEVRRVLRSVGLEDEMHRKLRAMSGGMRQRVAIACALLRTPELLVLDEPASGLDPDQRLRLRSILSEHGRAHTVVLSTHDTAEVAASCQRVIVVLDGAVRFDGTPHALADVAAGRVWLGAHAAAATTGSWVGADGRVRMIGTPPAGATLAAPTLEDGYLLLVRDDAGRR
jgi:ABC-2 type transport system ATP-binding protein